MEVNTVPAVTTDTLSTAGDLMSSISSSEGGRSDGAALIFVGAAVGIAGVLYGGYRYFFNKKSDTVTAEIDADKTEAERTPRSKPKVVEPA